MELRQVQVRTVKEDRYVMNGIETTHPAKYAVGNFHCWENYQKGKFSRVRGIVELEDGTVNRFDIEDVKFIDKPLEANDANSYFLMD